VWMHVRVCESGSSRRKIAEGRDQPKTVDGKRPPTTTAGGHSAARGSGRKPMIAEVLRPSAGRWPQREFMAEKNEVTDVLGLAPYGKALNTLTKGALEGAGAFLSRICLPVAEEFGLLLKDKVSNWRKQNAVEITLMAKDITDTRDNSETIHAHPRLVMKIMEEGSWSDSTDVQKMWAGLLASSCSMTGKDESNLLFINILSKLTSTEARLINYFSGKCNKKLSQCGLIHSEGFSPSVEELYHASGFECH